MHIVIGFCYKCHTENKSLVHISLYCDVCFIFQEDWVCLLMKKKHGKTVGTGCAICPHENTRYEHLMMTTCGRPAA